MASGAITIQEAIDEIGYGRFQRRMLVVCGVTWAADAAEVLFIGFALPAIRAEFGLDGLTSGLSGPSRTRVDGGAATIASDGTGRLYPTVVRGTGFGAASGMSRIGGAIAPIIGGSLLAISLVIPLALYATAFVLAAAAVGLLGVETRGGSLADILPARPGEARS